MRATVFAAFAATVVLARFTEAQQPVFSEAPLINRDHLVIDGAETFTAEQISRALWTDLDVALTGITPSSAGEQRRVLVIKTITGYRHAGFPDVQARLNAGAAVITIDEGPRFMAGAVRVEGAKAIDVARLIDALKPPPPDESAREPYWPTGEPAWFDQPTKARIAEGIASRLADQGYYRPAFRLRIERDEADHKADLVIELADEGEPSTLADLRFVGNHKNSHEEILTYLGIGRDAVLTRDLRGQIASNLNASGRFVRCEWPVDELAERAEGWQPKLALDEYLAAPTLSEPLSREEAAFVKFSQWVAAFDAGDDEIAISFHGADEWTDVVLAPREGFLALNGKCGEDRQASAFRAAVVMSEKQVGLYSCLQQRKIVAVPPPAHMIANGSLTVVGGAPSWDGRSAFMFGAGTHSKARNGTRRHLKLHLAQTASGALSVVRKHQASCSWEGDVLTARWNARTLRIDATDGRLVEHIVVDKPQEGDKDGQATDAANVVRTWTSRGEYARRLAEIDAATATFENRADAQRPLSCVAEFVCEESKAQGRLDQLPACERAVPVVAKLAAHGLFRPLDELLLLIQEPAGERFQIPAPPGAITRFHDLPSALKWLATYVGLWSGDSLFGQRGWLADLWRGEAIFLARGQLATPGSFGDRAFDGFSAPRGGPLWALVVAQLLHWQSLDAAATSYAHQGLRMLSARDFRRDYRELLTGNTLASEYLLGIVDVLRTLDPDEIDALADALVELEVLSAENAQQGGAFLKLLHADQLPTKLAIAQALDRCWKQGLCGWVDERLQHLADLPYSQPPVLAAPGQSSPVIGGPLAIGPPPSPASHALGPGYNGPAARYFIAPAAGSGYGETPPQYGGATYNRARRANGPPARPGIRYAAGPTSDYTPEAVASVDEGPATIEGVQEQIERLQALVRSLSYRVAEVESRLPPQDESDDVGSGAEELIAQ